MNVGARLLACALVSAEAAMAQGLDGLGPTLPDEPAVLGPAGTSIPAPSDLRVFPVDEKRIGLMWRHVNGADGYRVFRRREPILSPALTDLRGFADMTPFAWTEIGTLNQTGTPRFVDSDIPPIDPSASLALRSEIAPPVCYRVEAFDQNSSAFTEAVCARRRGLNEPRNVKAEAVDATTAKVTWTDASSIEVGFELIAREGGALKDTVSAFFPGETGGAGTISGLQPATRYCIDVRAVGMFAKSSRGSDCDLTTPAAPESAAEDTTVPLDLIRLEVVSPDQINIPYARVFSPAGAAASHVIKKVELSPIFPPLQFLKQTGNFGTQDCGKPDAVVLLRPGNATTPENLKAIFGSETPGIPRTFVACVAPTGGPVFDFIQIKVTHGPAAGP